MKIYPHYASWPGAMTNTHRTTSVSNIFSWFQKCSSLWSSTALLLLLSFISLFLYTWGEDLVNCKFSCITHTLSLPTAHRPDMTEILLKKTLKYITHPSIHPSIHYWAFGNRRKYLNNTDHIPPFHSYFYISGVSLVLLVFLASVPLSNPGLTANEKN